MKINLSDIENLRSEIPNYIGGKRLAHTYSVEREAEKLGKIFSLPEESLMKLRIAALLHDITKEKTTNEQISLCDKFGIRLSEDDLCSPKILHSLTGAYTAREMYGKYVDDVIFDAIKYHTTGRKNMTLTEKLIYLADYIEPLRDFPDCIELRRYFYDSENISSETHLSRTLLLSYDMTLKNLISDGLYIHGATVAARNGIIAELANLKQ